MSLADGDVGQVDIYGIAIGGNAAIDQPDDQDHGDHRSDNGAMTPK